MDYLKKPLSERFAILKMQGVETMRLYSAGYGFAQFESRVADSLRWRDGTVQSSNRPHRLRFVGAAHKLVYLRHTGWYVDNCQSETTSGVVYRLPKGRGFLAGYSDPWNGEKDGSGPHSLDCSEVHETAEEAARRADRLAELYAEFCREDDAKQAAESRIESIRDEELPELREQVRALAEGIRQSKLAPVVCDAMREKIRALRREMGKLHALSAKLSRNYWEAVPA